MTYTDAINRYHCYHARYRHAAMELDEWMAIYRLLNNCKREGHDGDLTEPDACPMCLRLYLRRGDQEACHDCDGTIKRKHEYMERWHVENRDRKLEYWRNYHKRQTDMRR